jgi:SAM-dependent methyltransferase
MSPVIGAPCGSVSPVAAETPAGGASFVATERSSLPVAHPGNSRALPPLERIETVYRAHHEARRSRDFVFCGPERRRIFRAWVGTGRRVLDVGCRYGALTRAYLEGNEVVGMDVDREALAGAAKLGIEPLWADAGEPFPLEDESFDAVVVGELLEHLPFPDALIAEARRVLRPGGRLVGSVPNAFRLKSRLSFLVGRPPQNDPTTLQLFSPEDVRRLLAGFEGVRLQFVAGRLTPLHPRLFANDICFTGLKPQR